MLYTHFCCVHAVAFTPPNSPVSWLLTRLVTVTAHGSSGNIGLPHFLGESTFGIAISGPHAVIHVLRYGLKTLANGSP